MIENGDVDVVHWRPECASTTWASDTELLRDHGAMHRPATEGAEA